MKFGFLLLWAMLLLLSSGCGSKSGSNTPNNANGLPAPHAAGNEFHDEQGPSGFFPQQSDDDKWRAQYYFSHLRKKIFSDLPGGVTKNEHDLPVVLNDRVHKYINYFRGPARKEFSKWLGRSGKYIPSMKTILKKRDLPTDLVYLAMIESGFNVKARSRRGAVGPWQFMRSTAKRYGLRVDYWIDERMDPVKSTMAAADYLSDLYKMFENWELAAAGYNAGERRVRRALRKTDSSNFWDLSGRALPRETKNYVPKLIAALIIAKNPERYGFKGIKYQKPEPVELIAVPSRKSLRDIAKVISLKHRVLRELNPSLIAGATPPGGDFKLKVPVGYGKIVSNKLEAIASLKTVNRATYRVKRGDTLGGISHRFHVSISSIKDANGIRGSLIRIGQVLKIPRSYAGTPKTSGARKKSYAKHSSNGKPASGKKYVVKKGDNPYDIAMAHNISVKSLLKHNGKTNPKRLKIGEVLYIPSNTADHSTASSKNEVEYVVKRGDTLGGISHRLHVDVSSIRDANGIRGSSIRAGQVLKIPRSNAGTPKTPKANKKSNSAHSSNGKPKSGKKYVVKKGDNPYDIALAHNISVKSLLKHNGKTNPKRLKIGEVLYIPSNTTDHSTASSKTEVEYIVKRGDTLSDIAVKYSVPLSELKKWNKMSSDKLVAGDSLKIYID